MIANRGSKRRVRRVNMRLVGRTPRPRGALVPRGRSVGQMHRTDPVATRNDPAGLKTAERPASAESAWARRENIPLSRCIV